MWEEDLTHLFGLTCNPPRTDGWVSRAGAGLSLSLCPASVSHGVADGCGIVAFLLNWARATMNQPLSPIIQDRTPMRASLTHDQAKALGMPPNYVPLSRFGEARLYMSLAINQIRSKNVTLYFPQAELNAIKAEAMKGLEGEG